MLKEQHFPDLNRYPKTNGTPVSTVEEWLDEHPEKRAENQPNGGIIRATSAVVFVDMLTRAQRENKQALKVSAKKEGAGRPKTRTDMPTARGQQILDQMINKGFYDAADFELSHTYLSNIISQMRELGYTVNIVKGEKRKASRYELAQ